jgi:ATP-binding cassette subfamily B protein
MNKILKMDVKLFQINKLAFVMYSLIGLACTFLPFMIYYFVDLLFGALQATNQTEFYLLITIFVVLNALYVLSIKYSAVFDVRATFSVGKRIRKNIIGIILKNKNIKISTVGSFVDILENDVDPMEYLLLTHIDFVEQLLYLIVTILILCKINTIVTMTIIVPFLLISFVGQYIGEIYKEKYSESRNNSIEFSSIISDIVKNRESLQYFADRESIREVFRKKCYLRGKSSYQRNVYDKVISIGIKSLNYICVSLLMLIAAKMFINTELSIGDFTLYLSYIGFGCSYLSLLKDTIYGIKSVNDSINRISENIMLDVDETHSVLFSPMETGSNKEETTNPGRLQFTNFKMCSNDREHSFTMKENEMVAVTGSNGSGKTKFINCIMGYAPYEGKITIDGRNINEMPVHFGYSSQKIFLFDASIEDNVTVFSVQDDWQDALKFANIDTEMQKWRNDNSNKTIGVNGKRLSEGQRQRVSIARAIYNGSKIYIFDDSFAFIDKKNRKEIFEKIRHLKGIKIFVSNDKNIINFADRVLYIEDECLIKK